MARPVNAGTARVLHGNARALPLDDASVDLVVTSPPYYGLRSYKDDGEHYDGQIGSETSPEEFVDALLEVTKECVRVLKPTGSLWVNLGDKYSTPTTPQPPGATSTIKPGGIQDIPLRTLRPGAPTKSLIGVPWRYALACIDRLGLILRAEVIWSKPNGMPETVTDRVRRSHEHWFHFTTRTHYYEALDELREPQPDGTLGRIPGSVWTVSTEGLEVPAHLGIDHFAAFPSELPLRIITGWSPREICTACGEGRRPVAEDSEAYRAYRASTGDYNASNRDEDTGRYTGSSGARRSAPAAASNLVPDRGRRIVGYTCACPDTSAPATAGVVLDPFGGTGTTALVAKALGREGIVVDMSRDYCRLAEWRTNDPQQLELVRRRIRSHGGEAALTDSDDLGLLALLGDDASW